MVAVCHAASTVYLRPVYGNGGKSYIVKSLLEKIFWI
jgi:hypothetical protein